MWDACTVHTLCVVTVSHSPVCATRKKGRGSLKGTHLHFWGQALRGGGVGKPWLTLPPHPSTSLLAHTSVLSSHPLRDCTHCLHCYKPKWGTNRPFSVPGQGDEVGARTPDLPLPSPDSHGDQAMQEKIHWGEQQVEQTHFNCSCLTGPT